MVDDPRGISIEESFPAADPTADPPPVVEDDDGAEPEGVVEAGGRRLVDVSVVSAERRRVREATEKRKNDEIAALSERLKGVDDLKAALAAAQPYVELVKANPHLLQGRQRSAEEDVTDADAEQEARDLQLYDANGKLAIETARKVVARRRTEASKAANEAARSAVEPLRAENSAERSKQQFGRFATMTDKDGHQLVDPKILAEEWVKVDPGVTATAEGAEVVFDRAIGRMLREGKRPSGGGIRPQFTETPGGRSAPTAVQMTERARRMGLSKADLDASNKTFTPGGNSPIGEF